MNDLEVNKLLLLLDEYSEKLTKLCVVMNRKVISIYIINAVFLDCIFIILNLRKKLLLSPILYHILLFILIAYFIFFNIKKTQNIFLFRYRIKAIKEILEKIIRFGSQVIELNNIDSLKKMQLDFKLLTAELVLEYYFGRFDNLR